MGGGSRRSRSSPAARRIDPGILEEFTGHARNRRFRYAPTIALFHERQR